MSGASSRPEIPAANDGSLPTTRKIQRVCWWAMLCAGAVVVIYAIVTDNVVLAVCNTIIAMGGLVLLMNDRRRG